MQRKEGLSPGKKAALTAVEIALREGALELHRRKFPKKPPASESLPQATAPSLSDEEVPVVLDQPSLKPGPSREDSVVTIDAEAREISVPTADDLHVPANQKPGAEESETFPEQSLRGSRRRAKGRAKGRGEEGDISNSVPLIQTGNQVLEAEQIREAERQSLRDQIQERDAKPRESVRFSEPEPEDPDNEGEFAQRKRDQWSLPEETKEVEKGESTETPIAERLKKTEEEALKSEQEQEEKKSERGEAAIAERLKKAQEEVAEARRQFIKEDFNKTSSWNKVKSFFGLKSEDSALGANSDVESYQDIYKEKLLLFQDLQFQAIKESGVTGEAMKEAFAFTLRYFKHDEAVRLYQARTEVRRENQHWGDRVAGVFENMGKEYNKLSMTKKLALSAALIGGSFATGGASLLAKRLLSGAGTFVGVEGLLEKWAENKESSQAQKEISEQIHGLDLSLALDQKMLENYIKQDIDGLGSKLQKKKRDMLLRKGMALGIGVGIGSGAFSQLAMEHLGGKETLQAAGTYVKDYLGESTIVPEATTPPASVAIPESMGENMPSESEQIEKIAPTEQEVPPSSAPPIEFADEGVSPESEQIEKIAPTEQEALIADIQKALEAESQEVNETSPAKAEYSPEARQILAREVLLEDGGQNFLQDYQLTRADGPRGLWGVLESRLPADLPTGEKNAMVQKLENLMAERLAEMTPEQQIEAGFRSGDINKIYAGETLKFNGLLTVEDVQKIVGGEVLPDGEAIVTPDVSETPGSIEGDAVDSVPESDIPNAVEPNGDVSGDSLEEVYNDNPVTADIQYERDIILGKEYNLQSYKEYFRLNEEALPFFRESGIEYMNFISQDNPAMMRSIGEKTFAALDRSTLQGTSLEKFITLAGQTYGKSLGLPGPKEKVYEYVMRMAMLSVEHPTRERIPLPQLFSV